jgi:hypothetical protein
MPDEDKDLDDRLREAKAAGAPEHYTNGCAMGVGSSDIVILFERNNDPVAILNLSFTAAKSLSVGLGLMIAQIEERSHREIMTSQFIDGLFSEEATGTEDVDSNHRRHS